MSDERNSLAWAGIAATNANETPNARMDSIFRIYPPASLEEKCRHSIEGCVHGGCRNAIMLFRTASLRLASGASECAESARDARGPKEHEAMVQYGERRMSGTWRQGIAGC